MNQTTSPHSTVSFDRWQAPHFRPINKFYKSQKHKGKANGDDWVFYAYQKMDDDEEMILGAVRLVPYSSEDGDTYFWLRSMYIHQDWRGQKLGLALLNCVHEHISKMPIYCFPYDYLGSFYSQGGYQPLDAQDLPTSLADLYERYQRAGEKILVMGRHAK